MSEQDRVTGGVIGGGILGALIAGPSGAVLGGLVGAVLAELRNEEERKKKERGW